MKQKWTQARITTCALHGCTETLSDEWALSWHHIGNELYATCQGGHQGINDRAELIAQIQRIEQSRQRIAKRRAQKNPTD